MATLVGLMYATRAYVPGTFVGSKIHFFMLGSISGFCRSFVPQGSIASRYVVSAQVTALGLLLLFTFGVISMDVAFKDDFYRSSIPPIVFSIGIFFMSYDTAFSRATLASQPLQLAGNWSFSMYLVNEIVIYIINGAYSDHPVWGATVTFTAIVMVSYLSFRWIETPGLLFLKRAGGNFDSRTSMVVPIS